MTTNFNLDPELEKKEINPKDRNELVKGKV